MSGLIEGGCLLRGGVEGLECGSEVDELGAVGVVLDDGIVVIEGEAIEGGVLVFFDGGRLNTDCNVFVVEVIMLLLKVDDSVLVFVGVLKEGVSEEGVIVGLVEEVWMTE